MRPIIATVSRAALAHNLAQVRRYAPKSSVMAVVKANGYGHGLLNVAQGLKAADAFAVLNPAEAIALRDAGYQQPILLLEGVFAAAQLAEVDRYRLDMVVHHNEQITWLMQAVLTAPIRIFLKLDSGMHRLGFQPAEYAQALQQLTDCRNVSEVVLMTHFANADHVTGVRDPMQLISQCMSVDRHPRSLANSAAIIMHPQTHADWVRPGIMLYGATPVADQSAESLGLKPAMQLHSALIAVQPLVAGQGLGYGHLFTATQPMRVGIVACGYADGYPRHALSGTPVAVQGVMTRTLGRVSMDMLAVDISDIPAAQVGSPVELWGAQVPVDVVASHSGTIGYELLCAVSSRVPLQLVP